MDAERAIRKLRLLMDLGKEAIQSEEAINPEKGIPMAEVAMDREDIEAIEAGIRAMRDVQEFCRVMRERWETEDG